jgi:hypothetical protein
LGAWLGAIVLAVVVLGGCAYEIRWKAKRLRGDLAALRTLGEDLVGVGHELAAAAQRGAAPGAS